MKVGSFAGGLALAASALLGGCTYRTVATAPATPTIFSNFQGEVPGSYALAVDGQRLVGTFSPLGFTCGMASFPVDAADAFQTATSEAVAAVVDQVVPVASAPAAAELQARSLTAAITVLGEQLDVDVGIAPGLLHGDIDARSRVTASYTVDGSQGRLLGGTVIGEGSTRIEGGPGCSGGASAVSEATGNAIGSVTRQIGERLSNSEWLRAAGARPASPPGPAPAF